MSAPARDLPGAFRAIAHLTEGYGRTVSDVVGDALFDEASTEPVLVRDIPFTSLCRQHLMPFVGRAHVAYLPAGRVVGLSKLARVVDLFAHRLQTQTGLADDIAAGLQQTLGARGVGVWLEARHFCPEARGRMLTRCLLGEMKLPQWRDWAVGWLG